MLIDYKTYNPKIKLTTITKKPYESVMMRKSWGTEFKVFFLA